MSAIEEMEAGRRALARRQGRSMTGSGRTGVRHTTQRTVPECDAEVAGIPSPSGETTGTVFAAPISSEPVQIKQINPDELLCEQQANPSSGQAAEWCNEGCIVDSEEIAQFMARVVPWPEGDAAPGYINLHWTIPQPTGKPKWTGKPVRSVADFQRLVNWVLSRPNTGDIYYCLSLQSKAGINKRGSPIAERSLQNALAVKALWLDIDVKEPPNGYATVQEAWAALKDFYRVVGLPRPSAMVASGGGLHVYWISKTPLTLDQWRPLAVGLKNAALKHGLRCDACCTIDAARILRVPGTWNCKTEPKRPVKLLTLEKDYDF
jgi:hypothetical protein